MKKIVLALSAALISANALAMDVPFNYPMDVRKVTQIRLTFKKPIMLQMGASAGNNHVTYFQGGKLLPGTNYIAPAETICEVQHAARTQGAPILRPRDYFMETPEPAYKETVLKFSSADKSVTIKCTLRKGNWAYNLEGTDLIKAFGQNLGEFSIDANVDSAMEL